MRRFYRVAFPILIVCALPAAAAQEELPAAELTVHLVGPPSGETEYIEILALGGPPTAAVVATDPSGTNVATVTPLGSEACGGDLAEEEAPRDTGLGDTPWCLQVEGLGAGSEAVANLATDQMTLKLTLATKHTLTWPLLVLIIAILASVGLSYWTTHFLPDVVARARLRRALRDNDLSAPETKVHGLSGWVGDRRLEGATDGALFPIVSWLRRRAAGLATAARARLHGAECASKLPQESAARKTARDEIARGNDPAASCKVGDFYTGLTRREKHPADELLGTLARCERLWDDLDRAKWYIDKLPEAERAGLMAIWTNARAVATQVADEDGLALLKTLHMEVWRKIDDRLADPKVRQGFAGELLALELIDVADMGPMDALAAAGVPEIPKVEANLVPLPIPRGLPGGGLDVADIPIAGIATTLTAVLFGIIAATTVASSAILPKPTFGVWQDYLALAVAAFGSSTVATLLTIFALWRTTAPSAKA